MHRASPHLRCRFAGALLGALLVAGSGAGASAEGPPSTRVVRCAFSDADVLSTPDRATDGHPFAPGSVAPFPARRPRPTLVDLHAHAFMDRGLGLLFDGDFRSPLRSTSFSDLFSSQINADTLEASGLGLVVVSLYAHPVLAPDRRGSIRQQIRDAREFVRTHDDWILAKDPREARAAYEHGKRVIVLSLEGASGILDTEDDIRELVDDAGIRIVTFAHLADDKLTGAALGYGPLANPRGLVSAALAQSRGLTPQGRAVASRLLAHHVWIDLAHASGEATVALMTMMLQAGQPLLYTHMALHDDEDGVPIVDDLLRVVRGSGGIVGLVPGESMLGRTRVPSENCPAACEGRCGGGVFALAAQWNAVARVVGEEHTFLGSDFNGAQVHLAPGGRCPTGTTLDEKGLYNISQTGELWDALRTLGALSTANQEHGVENFLAVWDKVYPASSGSPGGLSP